MLRFINLIIILSISSVIITTIRLNFNSSTSGSCPYWYIL